MIIIITKNYKIAHVLFLYKKSELTTGIQRVFLTSAAFKPAATPAAAAAAKPGGGTTDIHTFSCPMFVH
jgi:hypothetical protein